MGLLLELPMSDIAKREEHDLLGVKLLPKSAYYGVQTARALDNFNMSGIQLHLYPDLINALAMVKLAAARANFECGQFSREVLNGIETACLEIISEKQVLSKEEIERVLDPAAMTGQGRPA
jgi:aspartate ammonia-lyase